MEETYRKELTIIRNKLYDNLPTGEVSAFDLTTVIQLHLRELDFFIDQLQPVTAKTEQSLPNDYVKSQITEPVHQETNEQPTDNVFLIHKDGNTTRLYKNGVKISPTEFTEFYGCEMTDEQKKLLEIAKQEYFDVLTEHPIEQEKPSESAENVHIEKCMNCDKEFDVNLAGCVCIECWSQECIKDEELKEPTEWLKEYPDQLVHANIDFLANMLVQYSSYLTSQKHLPTDEEMNQKAIEYGKQKKEHRYNLTDYQQSEAEIDFLRGYNAAVRDYMG